MLWTPEGFYEATPGAQDVLKWVVNHGPDKTASVLPRLGDRQAASTERAAHILDELETARALGVDDMTQARLDVQAKTGSAKPPGGVLHVLAIGIDNFGKNAGGLISTMPSRTPMTSRARCSTPRKAPGKASTMPTSAQRTCQMNMQRIPRSWIGSMRWRRALRGAIRLRTWQSFSSPATVR